MPHLQVCRIVVLLKNTYSRTISYWVSLCLLPLCHVWWSTDRRADERTVWELLVGMTEQNVTGDLTSIWITLLCVCIVWKYVLCVECASVRTLYIVSCMSKWWRWWVVLWCWLACRWRQLDVGVSQSALRKSAYQCPVNWANQWLTRSARFVLYKRGFGSSIQSAIVTYRVSVKYCQYSTVL